MTDPTLTEWGDSSSSLHEERLLRAQRVARLGSWELDLSTRVMWGSDEASRIYGLDTGPGMSPDVQNRAFDLLFSTREKGQRKGQGLGLAVVYNAVVRHHHGLVDIESSEGHGCAFHLYLPRGVPFSAEESPRDETIRGGNETILVVEDEPQLIALTQEVLNRLGYTVLTATDGQEGIDVFNRHVDDIDLVLLDRTLPGLAGDEVLRRILALQPGARVVISSGDPTVDSTVVPGAKRILHKPYNLTVLFDTIRDVLEDDRTSSPYGR